LKGQHAATVSFQLLSDHRLLTIIKDEASAGEKNNSKVTVTNNNARNHMKVNRKFKFKLLYQQYACDLLIKFVACQTDYNGFKSLT
jgi:hypothetical protein